MGKREHAPHEEETSTLRNRIKDEDGSYVTLNSIDRYEKRAGNVYPK